VPNHRGGGRRETFLIQEGASVLTIIHAVKWRASDYPITVGELRSVSKEFDRLLTEDERNALIDCLACNPEAGVIMPGTGGVRKMRWPYASKGKSTGLRVLYYFHDLNMPLYILAVYSKGEVLRPTVREEREMAKLVRILVKQWAARNHGRLAAQGSA
jgi:hypothetical protein